MSENQTPEQVVQPVQQPVVVQVVQQQQTPQSSLCIAGFIVSFVSGIIGLILSLIGIRKCNKEGLRGKGFGIAGVTISAIKLIGIGIYLTMILIVQASFSYKPIENEAQDIGQKGVDIVQTEVNGALSGN